MANQGHCLAVLNLDVNAIEDLDIRLGRVVELDLIDVNDSLVGVDHLRSHLFPFIVAFLQLRLHHEASDLIEGTLHFGYSLKIGVQAHDIPQDLPVVKKVGRDLTRSEFSRFD